MKNRALKSNGESRLIWFEQQRPRQEIAGNTPEGANVNTIEERIATLRTRMEDFYSTYGRRRDWSKFSDEYNRLAVTYRGTETEKQRILQGLANTMEKYEKIFSGKVAPMSQPDLRTTSPVLSNTDRSQEQSKWNSVPEDGFRHRWTTIAFGKEHFWYWKRDSKMYSWNEKNDSIQMYDGQRWTLIRKAKTQTNGADVTQSKRNAETGLQEKNGDEIKQMHTSAANVQAKNTEIRSRQPQQTVTAESRIQQTTARPENTYTERIQGVQSQKEATQEVLPSGPINSKKKLDEIIDTFSREKITNNTSRDERVIGDFTEIRDGLIRFREVARTLSPEEQEALKKVSLVIVPMGTQSMSDYSWLELDVTETNDAMKKILQRELAENVFALQIQKKLPRDLVDQIYSRRLKKSTNREEVAEKLCNVLLKLPQDVQAKLREKRIWIYLEDGDSHHSGNLNIAHINIRESEEHIRDFFLQKKKDEPPENKKNDAVNKAEQKLIENQGKPLVDKKIINGISVDSDTVKDFAEIKLGLSRFETAVTKLSPDEQLALRKLGLCILEKGRGSFHSFTHLFIDVTIQPEEKLLQVIRSELKDEVFTLQLQRLLPNTIKNNVKVENIEKKIPPEAIAQKLTSVFSRLDPDVQKEVSKLTLYLIDGKLEHRRGVSNYATINISLSEESLRQFFDERFSDKPRDNVYMRIRTGVREEVTIDPTKIGVWIERQKKFKESMTDAGSKPREYQLFPPEVRRGLLDAEKNPLKDIQVTGTGEKGAKNSVSITVGQNEPKEQWGLMSDHYVDKVKGCAENVYLFDKQNPDIGLLLPWDALFKSNGDLDPVRLRRYMDLAKQYDKSEKDDPAEVGSFELAEKGSTVGCLTLMDGQDKKMVVNRMRESVEKFPSLLKNRYDVTSAGLVDVKDGVNPVAAAREQIRILVEEKKVSSVYINLLAHGDNTAAYYDGGKLRATDLLDVFKEFPHIKFTVNTMSCYGAGLEEAMDDFTDPEGQPGRITIFLAGKRHTTNVANGITDTSGDEAYANIYEAAMVTLLADPKNATKSYGALHLQADAIARTFSLRNPGVWRSWGKAKSRQTAQMSWQADAANVA